MPADELLTVDQSAAPVGPVASRGSQFVYRYDFGDDWEHEIEVEAITESGLDRMQLRCIAGARARPPEDCGGVPGYDNLLRVLANPDDEEYANLKRWVGRGFDPEKFEIDKINKKLAALGRRIDRRIAAQRRSHAFRM